MTRARPTCQAAPNYYFGVQHCRSDAGGPCRRAQAPPPPPPRAFWTDSQRTIRTARWRLIAAHADVVRDLRAQLDLRPELPAKSARSSEKKKSPAGAP